jgi:hypothetical protein
LSQQEERSYSRSIELLTQELAAIVETCRPMRLPSQEEDEAEQALAEPIGWTGQFANVFSAVTGQRTITDRAKRERRQ